MNTTTNDKIEELRSDYKVVTGNTFSHFFCPILFRDEDAALCRAHIVNQAFLDSARRWTIQRADVDSFYGSSFEADFTDIQYAGSQPLEQFFIDPNLSKRFRPQLLLNNEAVPYYVPRGPIPSSHTGVILGGPSGEMPLALKMEPAEASSIIAKEYKLEIAIEKDLRLPALVSLLKAAHLTVFAMLGYRYALSPGGIFLGHTVLGKFFLENKGLPKTDVIKNAPSHFAQLKNMVRPVLSQEAHIRGTISDGFLFMCFCGRRIPWAIIVFVRTKDRMHAALVTVFAEQNGAARFVDFLRGEEVSISAEPCRFEDNKWQQIGHSQTLSWPRVELG